MYYWFTVLAMICTHHLFNDINNNLLPVPRCPLSGALDQIRLFICNVSVSLSTFRSHQACIPLRLSLILTVLRLLCTKQAFHPFTKSQGDADRCFLHIATKILSCSEIETHLRPHFPISWWDKQSQFSVLSNYWIYLSLIYTILCNWMAIQRGIFMINF